MKLQKCSQSDRYKTLGKLSSCNMKLAVVAYMNSMNSVFSEEGEKRMFCLLRICLAVFTSTAVDR